MASVCTDDLRAELQFYKSFKHDDSQLPYVASVLGACSIHCVFAYAIGQRLYLPFGTELEHSTCGRKVAAILLQVADQQEVNGFYLYLFGSFLPSALWCLALQSLLLPLDAALLVSTCLML